MNRYKKLLVDSFSLPRHPFYNGDNLASTRNAIVAEFEKIIYKVPNVSMEMQSFKAEISIQSSPAIDVHGKNIIVTFGGVHRGTSKDQVLVIGAHYDSDRSPLLTVDDNGSGVVAMLETARELADAIVKRKAILYGTIIFVAFDVQLFELVLYIYIFKHN